MPNAQVVKSWSESGIAYLAVRVDEGVKLGQVEYIGAVPITPDFQALSPTGKKAALIAAAKKVRDTDPFIVGPPAQTDLGITGSVTL